MEQPQHMRFHAEHAHLASTFGSDWFGAFAERLARFFGTPTYLIGQSLIVIAWMIVNALALIAQWDPYPFILLNLVFSLQAAYAAPLILLAQTRQSDRDKVWSEADAKHREALSEQTLQLLHQNTEITQQVRQLSDHVRELTEQIHAQVVHGPS
ncbi:MAG TPA: DUF1003 domain-containing protein [Dehalococcoidia bacterium]|nr:DUF1003 domain-containing protein [Dehalococcoidia bacterium]